MFCTCHVMDEKRNLVFLRTNYDEFFFFSILHTCESKRKLIEFNCQVVFVMTAMYLFSLMAILPVIPM
jgi:hypothetical protein